MQREIYRGVGKGLGLLIAGLLACDLTAHYVRAQAPTKTAPKVLIAQEFRLVDKEGKPRASLALSPENSAGIALLDAEGNRRAELSLQETGETRLVLYDKAKAPRAALRLRADGSPTLSLHDPDSRPRASLDARADGSCSLTLNNQEGKGGAALLVLPNGDTRGIFKDKAGNIIWTAPEPDVEIPPDAGAEKPPQKP